MSSMQTDTKAAVLKRFNRIEGQVRGLARMVEEDRYCIDVVTQISAVQAALRRAEGTGADPACGLSEIRRRSVEMTP